MIPPLPAAEWFGGVEVMTVQNQAAELVSRSPGVFLPKLVPKRIPILPRYHELNMPLELTHGLVEKTIGNKGQILSFWLRTKFGMVWEDIQAR